MAEEITHEPTRGERLVHRLLSKLPRQEFYFQYEPQINVASGQTHKPDFVVVSATMGVITVEVKDWVKLVGGDQENIHIIQANGNPLTLPNPVRVAERYAYALNKRFEERAEFWEKRNNRRMMKFPWQIMVIMPNISQKIIHQFEEQGIWQRNIVIGKESLGTASQLEYALRNLPWRFTPDKSLNRDLLDLIREIINPRLLVADREGTPIGTLTRIQEKLINEPIKILTPQQLPLTESDTEPVLPVELEPEVRLVRGVAGSGKTLVLTRRVRHLLENYPEAKILVLTFNVELADDLRQRIDLPEEVVKVTNFHKICRQILNPIWRRPLNTADWLRKKMSKVLKEAELSVEFIAEEIAWRRERQLLTDDAYLNADRKGRGYRLDHTKRAIVNEIFNQYLAFKQQQKEQNRDWFDWDDVAFLAAEGLPEHELFGAYHAILIDEAQDFTPSWMQVVRMLLKPGGSLLLCDDPAQSIFNSYTWIQKNVQVVGRSVILNVPFRSTREISMTAHALIEADENLRQTEERPEPDFGTYELGSGTQPLLVQCADDAEEVEYVTAAVIQLLSEGVQADQIAILCQHKRQTALWSPLQQMGVYVNYFEKMKGLEFNIVFVPHLHSAFMPTDDAEIISAKRRKFFTAMTRARYQLTLTYQQILPEALTPILEHVQHDQADFVRS